MHASLTSLFLLISSFSARIPVVKQGGPGSWHPDIYIQAILPSRSHLGWNDNNRAHKEALPNVFLYCRCLCCKHDIP